MKTTSSKHDTPHWRQIKILIIRLRMVIAVLFDIRRLLDGLLT